MGAGVSRQTVYAHFKSREVLVSTVIDAITSEAVSEMDAAALDEGPAAEALLRLLDASWRTLQRYPLLLSTLTAAAGTEAKDTRHETVFDHLDQVLKRGQERGEFARDLPTTWLARAIVALGHAAGGEVTTGRITLPDAAEALARSTLRMCGADPSTIDDLVDRRGGIGGPPSTAAQAWE